MRNFKTFLQEENLPSFNWNTIKIENGKMLPNQFPNKVHNFDCEGIHNLTSLENSPLEVNKFWCSGTFITSLKGSSKIVNEMFFCDRTKITSLEFAPLIVKNFFDCYGNDIKSLEGIGRKYLKECKKIDLPDSIESNILGLCLIKNLNLIRIYDSNDLVTKGPLYEAIEIVKKHLGTDGDECMEELIQHGYKDYAKF